MVDDSAAVVSVADFEALQDILKLVLQLECKCLWYVFLSLVFKVGFGWMNVETDGGWRWSGAP